MSELFYRYMRGSEIPASEFATQTGAEIFGTFVWENHLLDQATAQLGLWGEVYWKKVHPIELHEGVLHNLRPPDNREGRRQSEIQSLDDNYERMRISELQEQLKADRFEALPNNGKFPQTLRVKHE